jgi:hypothetical protein
MTINKWIAGLLLAGCLLSCKSFQQKNGDNEYYYFPDKNIYYDVSRAMYLFSLDSGKTWDSLPASSETVPPVLGDKQVVYSNTDPVWTNNESDRAQYDGTLLNIVNELSLKPAETEGKVTVKSKPSNTPATKERKRPIKKFFDKIFGKKKKDG